MAKEDSDPRSPKRQAQAPLHSPLGGSAARAVASLDAAIWTSIIEYLPVPKDIELIEKGGVRIAWDAQIKHYDAAVSEVVATWRTLLNLRFVSSELATLLHPVDNKALWKRLLLHFFDFSASDDGFNTENFQDDHGLHIPDDEVDPDVSSEEDENEEEEEEEGEDQLRNSAEAPAGTKGPAQDQASAESEQDPQLVAMRGRYYQYSQPPNYLEEDLVSWYHLGISHRPSQYGFLKTLQQQPDADVWPESEDPFTLFGDLVRLLMLPHGERMIAGGEASDTTFKFLAAPTEADSSSAYFRFYVMKTLGYVPHFWHWGSGASGEWKGNTEPHAFDVSVKLQFPDKEANEDADEDDDDEDDERDKEDEVDFDDYSDFNFPDCTVGQAKRLYQNLRQHCQDWRATCCNSNSDGYTPVFFVGESKFQPHRWIGYAGGKCWT